VREDVREKPTGKCFLARLVMTMNLSHSEFSSPRHRRYAALAWTCLRAYDAENRLLWPKKAGAERGSGYLGQTHRLGRAHPG